MKIQELVYNRPNLIRSHVGSVSTFGQFQASVLYLLFFLPTQCNQCVFSQCWQKVKLNNASVHSSIIEKCTKERECYNYVCVQFSVDLCQHIHICVHMCVLVCVCVHQGMHICVTVSMLSLIHISEPTRPP